MTRLRRLLTLGALPLAALLLLAACAPVATLNALVPRDSHRIEPDVAYGEHPRQRLDIYRPVDAKSHGPNAPVCVFMYGGGWKSGERAAYAFVGAALAANGITAVIPDYRLYPDVLYPSFVEDCALAYRHVVERIARPAQAIVAAGHSAGAYNAALMTLDASYLAGVARRPAGLISISGPVSFEPTTWPSTAAIFKTATSADAPRPVWHVTAAAPPALSMHGAADTLVKTWNQQQLAAAYARVGRPIRALEFPGLGHMDTLLAISWPLRWRAPVLDEMLGFFRGVGMTG